MHRTLRPAIFSATLLLIFGVIAPAPQPDTSGAFTTLPSALAADSDIPDPAPDDSLTAAEYVEMGLPAEDRIWGGTDFGTAAAVLETIAETNALELPRYNSPYSGEVFARIVSPRNLDRYYMEDLSVEIRFGDIAGLLQGLSKTLSVYAAAHTRGDYMPAELIEIFGAMLRTSVATVKLTDEFLPTISTDDPNYETRMQGLEQMKGGLALIVSGALQSLTESGTYSLIERQRLVGYLKESLPTLVPRLPANSTLEMMALLYTYDVDLELADLQPGLGELAAMVSEAVDAPSTEPASVEPTHSPDHTPT